MSYSYVKTVFPQFQSSNVHNTNLYNLNKSQTNFNSSVLPFNDIDNTPDSIKLGQFPNEFNPKITQVEKFQNNLKYYNTPVAVEQTGNIFSATKESFDEQPSVTVDDEVHIKHVLECENCKKIILKQLGIESNRIFNDEVMELISYVIFAYFILMLLDRS